MSASPTSELQLLWLHDSDCLCLRPQPYLEGLPPPDVHFSIVNDGEEYVDDSLVEKTMGAHKMVRTLDCLLGTWAWHFPLGYGGGMASIGSRSLGSMPDCLCWKELEPFDNFEALECAFCALPTLTV